MARPSSISKARAEIARFFDQHKQRVFTDSELADLLEEHRTQWRLAPSVRVRRFAEILQQQSKLKRVELRSTYDHSATRHAWGDPSPFAIALSIKKRSYLSHGSALFLHGLTEEVPKTIYVNKEQSPKPRPSGVLRQDSIDRAFSRPQRESKLSYFVVAESSDSQALVEVPQYRFTVLSGKSTDDLEVASVVVRGELLRMTKLERTLIDSVVRPTYSGGAAHVLEAFRRAKSEVSVATLLATLKKLDFVYPYHQAIGFYMERAGFEDAALQRVLALGIGHDFYLTHGLKQPNYDEKWRLRYPEGL